MTDLTKDEIVKMAREAAARHGHTLKDTPEPATVEFITELVALCRADLVAEVERLKAVIDGKQDLWKLGHLMHEAWLQSDLKQKAHELTTAVTVMEQVIARNDALKSDRDDWKARALKAEQVGEPTTEQLAVLFTKESGGPNPYYRCRNCGKTEPGLQEYLAAHWKICVTPQPAAQRLTGREQAIEECAAECLVLHANGNYKHDTREDCHDAIRALAASPQEQT